MSTKGSKRKRRLLLLAAILAYRALPSAIKFSCPREGATCSARGYQAVRAGGGLADVRGIIASCSPSIGKHSPTCDFGP